VVICSFLRCAGKSPPQQAKCLAKGLRDRRIADFVVHSWVLQGQKNKTQQIENLSDFLFYCALFS
jgi:hypothetical protein